MPTSGGTGSSNIADDISPSEVGKNTPHTRVDIGAIAVIVIFSCLLCLPILVGRVPVPAETLALWAPWSQLPHEPITNSHLADATLLYLPSTVFARQAVADGEWPMWDPYSFGGFPYSANSQNQLYYPLTWLLWLLPLAGAIQVLTLFNVMLASMGMYLFLRHMTISPVGALISGLAFSGSGMLQLALEMPGVASVYGWLPWMLLVADKAMQTRTAHWTATAALVCGLQLVAGHLQWVLYSYFVLGCWVLWRAAFPDHSTGGRETLATIIRGGGIALGGVAIAAVHLAPFLELAALAGRAEGRVSSNSWPLYYLLRMLTPEYFGTATPGIGISLIFNDLWYVGIAPLLLALVALILRPTKDVWLWLGLSLLAVAVTFGIGPFLYARWLPGLSALLPMRIGYILIFSVAVLAGLGFDALRQKTARQKLGNMPVILFAGFFLVALLGAAWAALLSEEQDALQALKESQVLRAMAFLIVTVLLLLFWAGSRRMSKFGIPRWLEHVPAPAAALLVILLMLDLLSVAPRYNSWVKPDQVLQSTPAIDWLKANGGFERVMGVDSPGPVFNPNTQALFGIYSVAGYDSLHTRRLEEYWGLVDPTIGPVRRGSPYSNVFVRPQVYSSTLASLMNVRYLAAGDSFTPTASLSEVFRSEITLYENREVLPRAFLVGQAEVLSPVGVLQRLSAPDFDPKSAVLLEENIQSLMGGSTATGADPGSVIITLYQRNSVHLEVDLSRAAWLVLSDQNYPGWSVTVDGHPDKIYTAYYLFRAVRLDSGRHDIIFRFQPTSLIPAGLLSSVSLGAAAAMIGRGLLWRKRGSRPLAGVR